MSISDLDLEFENRLNLGAWLQSDSVGSFQRGIEEKIIQYLFRGDLEESQFSRAVQTLAWMGSNPAERALLQKEVIALNYLDGSTLVPCGFGKNLFRASLKICRFIAEHKKEILVGAALCATGIGIAAAAGYACSVAVGGVVVAGAGSIFAGQEEPKKYPTRIPPPASKQEIEIAAVSPINSLPKLDLPSTPNEFFVASDGIWANGEFYSNRDLIQQSHFREELEQFALINGTKPKFDPTTLAGSDETANPPPLERFLGRPILPDVANEQRRVRTKYEEDRILLSDILHMSDSQPSRSKSFNVDGIVESRGRISWINGINNSFEESKASARYIRELAGGHAVAGIYNCTHGSLVDILEAGVLNYPGYSPNTTELIQNEWMSFHEANRDRPNARLLQICHSQGAIHVRNALVASSPEIRDRVIVLAIAPAAVITNELCFNALNYASENDFVYKLEPAPSRRIISLIIEDGVMIPTFEEIIDHRNEIIILKPHPDAEGIDHSFKSPTYRQILQDVLAEYENRQGEYSHKKGHSE